MKAKVKAIGKVVEAVIDKCSVPASGYGAKFVYDCSDGKNILIPSWILSMFTQIGSR